MLGLKKKVVIGIIIGLILSTIGCSSEKGSSDLTSKSDTSVKVKLEITCEKNLMLSKYDVEVFVDNEKLGLIDHGQGGDYEVYLEPGKHTFRAQKKNESGVDGFRDFNVSEESILKCTLHCESDQVSLNDFSFLTLSQIKKSEEEKEKQKKEQEEASEQKRKQEEEAAAKKKQEEEEKAEQRKKEQEEAEAKKKQEEAEAIKKWGVPESELVSAATAGAEGNAYGKGVYHYGFKLHYIAGVIASYRLDDGSYFMKAYCDVKNAYGTWAKNMVCEVVVGGTETNPKVKSFNVY